MDRLIVSHRHRTRRTRASIRTMHIRPASCGLLPRSFRSPQPSLPRFAQMSEGDGSIKRERGERCAKVFTWSETRPSSGRQPLEGVVRNEGRADPERQEGEPGLSHPRQHDGDEEGAEENGDEPPWRDRLYEDDEKPERKEEDDDSVQAGRRQVREGRHLAADGNLAHNPMAGPPKHGERGPP